MKSSAYDTLWNCIIHEYRYSEPFFLKELYEKMPKVKQSTIREYIRRLLREKKLIKAKNGIYELPNPNKVLKTAYVNYDKLIDKSYLFDSKGNRVGYKSGLTIANKLGLTSQTESVTLLCSNNVSKKKREIKVNNHRVILNQARTEVTNQNYRLLQVLDLLNNFDLYSEYRLEDVYQVLIDYYTKDLSAPMLREETDAIVSSYPLKTQVKFYKMGGMNELT